MTLPSTIDVPRAADRTWDAVVIGAGIAGTLTAAGLAERGRRVLLVERRPLPRPKVCGCCLNRRAIAAFRQAGLEDVLTDLGGEVLSSVQLHDAGRRLVLPIPEGWAISRERLDAALTNAAIARGADLITETSAFVLPCLAEAETRTVILRGRHSAGVSVSAKLVVACDGLGHPSLQRLEGFEDAVKKSARLGLGVTIPHDPSDAAYPAGQIQMAVDRTGYVGAVRVEQERLNLAAAVDADAVAAAGSPAAAMARILEAAQLPVPPQLLSAPVKGTLPLTRNCRRVADHRLLLIGDATGYVEPFTGEGMAWAATAASAAVPLLEGSIEDWNAATIHTWTAQHRRLVKDRQRICGILGQVLRSPRLISATMRAARLFPRTVAPLVRSINRHPPEPQNELPL